MSGVAVLRELIGSGLGIKSKWHFWRETSEEILAEINEKAESVYKSKAKAAHDCGQFSPEVIRLNALIRRWRKLYKKQNAAYLSSPDERKRHEKSSIAANARWHGEKTTETLLSKRETQVLFHALEGRAKKEILERTKMSAGSYHTFRVRIMRKLKSKSFVQAAFKAVQMGAIDFQSLKQNHSAIESLNPV